MLAWGRIVDGLSFLILCRRSAGNTGSPSAMPKDPISSRTRSRAESPPTLPHSSRRAREKFIQTPSKAPMSVSKRTLRSRVMHRPQNDLCLSKCPKSQPSHTLAAKKPKTDAVKASAVQRGRVFKSPVESDSSASGFNSFESESASSGSDCESVFSVDVPMRSRNNTGMQAKKRPSPNPTPRATKKQRVVLTTVRSSISTTKQRLGTKKKATPRKHPVTPSIPERKTTRLVTKDHFQIAKER